MIDCLFIGGVLDGQRANLSEALPILPMPGALGAIETPGGGRAQGVTGYSLYSRRRFGDVLYYAERDISDEEAEQRYVRLVPGARDA